MFRDFRDEDTETVIETDLCIIGAGAAGITIAREMVGSQREVLLIESGGLEPEAETLALNEGSSVGVPHPPLDVARLRYFGGTTNHWDGHCRPLDAIDFEAREWLPYSGWPITLADLAPYYPRASEICELGPFTYDPETWRPAVPALLPLDAAKWVSRVWQYSAPTRFGQAYREELRAAPNVTVLLNANVVEIVVDEAGRAVTGLTLKALGEKEATVRARTVVLACGGIENPRLLLASNSVMRAGVGNQHDLVGRFFMEHPHTYVAYALPLDGIEQYAAYWHVGFPTRIPAGAATLQVKPALTEAFQRAHRLRNSAIDIGWGYSRDPGYLALRRTGKALLRRRVPDRLGEALWTMATNIDGLAEGVVQKLMGRNVFWFASSVEQEPNPASRVTLDDACDALGSPRARLDWQLTAGDKAETLRVARLLGEELARAGVARMRLLDWLLSEEPVWEDVEVRWHHIGTTRMSDDPKRGVVDADGRVHGIANLYVAGSSVFATAGYANPTLTIVALALRLADHLKGSGQSREQIGQEAPSERVGQTAGAPAR